MHRCELDDSQTVTLTCLLPAILHPLGQAVASSTADFLVSPSVSSPLNLTREYNDNPMDRTILGNVIKPSFYFLERIVACLSFTKFLLVNRKVLPADYLHEGLSGALTSWS